MAEMDVVVYNRLKADLMRGVHQFQAHTYKATLHAAYTPDVDNHALWADVSSTEYGTGAGYTAGGKTLAYVQITQEERPTFYTCSAVFENFEWTGLGPLSPATPSHIIVRNTSVSGEPLVVALILGVRQPNGGAITFIPVFAYGGASVSAFFGFVTLK